MEIIIPGVESCVCVSVVVFNVICDVSADELTASDDNNSYCYSIPVCLNACKLYHLLYSYLHLLLNLKLQQLPVLLMLTCCHRHMHSQQ